MKILYLPHAYSQQRQREKKRKIYPILMAMEAEYYRKQGHNVYWVTEWDNYDLSPFDKVVRDPEGLPFLDLPSPDRKFTKWWAYQDNGNFKYKPATYILSANGCWHGKCSFCVEKKRKYEVRDVENVIEEIKQCEKQGFREVFDDSGTFPTGVWLDSFCVQMKKVNMRISCNMRFNVLAKHDYKKMRKAGFRMILYGLESANQNTLDRIKKDIRVYKVVKELKEARDAGLDPHIAVMFGYPWETDKEALNTLKFVHTCLRKGYARTAQASLYTIKYQHSNEDHQKYVGKIYNAGFWPDFWINHLKFIKDKEDLQYVWKGIKEALRGGK